MALHEIDAGLRLLEEINTRLSDLDSRLSHLEKLMRGAQAVYVGNERLISKVTVNHLDLIYFVEANDRLIIPRFITSGSYEPEITNFFIKNISETSHCLDVGANFGYYSVIMGSCAHSGKTIAIEPDEKVFELLRDNVFINNIHQTTHPMQAAACENEGILTLYRRTTRSGNTSILNLPGEYTNYMGERKVEAFDVCAIPVDKLLPEFSGCVDFMKVDVEGAEPLVFRGARETIARNRHIRIVMEWSPAQIRTAGSDLADFVRELAAIGLRPAVLGQRGPEEVTWNTLLEIPYLSGVLLSVGR